MKILHLLKSHRKLFLKTCLISILILLSGCIQNNSQNRSDETSFSQSELTNRDISPQIPINTTTPIQTIRGDGDIDYAWYKSPTGSVLIAIIPQGKYDIALEEHDPNSVSHFATGSDEIIINAAYFHEDFSPSGYLMINEKRIGDRLFDQELSGALIIENRHVSIKDLNNDPLISGETFEYALQSFPFLIQDEVSALNEDSGKLGRRTAIGINNDFIFILYSPDQMSLYEFSNLIEDSQLGITTVLNLDGGGSSGIVIKDGAINFTKNSYSLVPTIIRISLENMV